MKHPQTLLLSAIEDIKVCIVAKEFEILFARKKPAGQFAKQLPKILAEAKKNSFPKI